MIHLFVLYLFFTSLFSYLLIFLCKYTFQMLYFIRVPSQVNEVNKGDICGPFY